METMTTFELIYWAVIYGMIFYAVDNLAAKSKLGIFFILTLPILFTPLILQGEANGWFNIVKSFTMLFVLFYASIIRFKFKGYWPRVILALLLYLNIFEAMLKDYEMANFFNFGTALILLLVIPLPSKLSLVKKQESNVDQITMPMSWAAIVLYTLWHLNFLLGYRSVRGFQGDYFLVDIVVLAIPFLVAYFRGRQFWLQARIYTLAFNILLIEATIVQHPEYWPLTPHWYSTMIYTNFSAAVFFISASTFVYLVVTKSTQLHETPYSYFTNMLSTRVSKADALEEGQALSAS